MKKYLLWHFYTGRLSNGMHGLFGVEEEGAKVIEPEGYTPHDALGGVSSQEHLVRGVTHPQKETQLSLGKVLSLVHINLMDNPLHLFLFLQPTENIIYFYLKFLIIHFNDDYYCLCGCWFQSMHTVLLIITGVYVAKGSGR